MEVEGKKPSSKKTATPQVDAGYAAPRTPAGRPLNVMGMLSSRPRASMMSQSAEEHLADVTKALETYGLQVTVVRSPISSFECVGIINNATDLCYVLIYDELGRSEGPIIRHSLDIEREIKNKYENALLVQMVEVIPEDFPKKHNLIAGIYDSILEKERTTTSIMEWAYEFKNDAGRLEPGVELVITNDPGIVKEQIKLLSPHTVRAKYGFGFCIFVTDKGQTPRKNDGSMGGKKIDYDNTDKLKPLIAVSGYTNWVLNDSDPRKVSYIPVPTISEVVSALPDPGLVMLAQMIAIERWLLKRDWLLEYQNYSENKPNPGSLILDENRQMCFIADKDMRTKFLTEYTDPEWLAMDIMEGRHRVPGMHAFGETSSDRLRNIIGKFFNISAAGIPDVVQHVFMKSCGYMSGLRDVETDNGLADSRYIDYLFEAVKIKNPERIAGLLNPEIGAGNLKRYIDENYPGQYKELFPLKTVLFNPKAMIYIHDLVRDIQIEYDGIDVESTASTSYLGHFGVAGATGSPYQGVNSFALTRGIGDSNWRSPDFV